MEKKTLTAAATKIEFIKSIHKWLMKTLIGNGFEKYCNRFNIEGSSIICELPQDYFSDFDIPEGTKIEMKFITKKS